MISGWYNIGYRKTKIEKVVGFYDVWTGDLPFSHFTVKVTEEPNGSYRASPNVFVNSKDGIEYCCGIAKTIENAVIEAVEAFYAEIQKFKTVETIEVCDFVWLCWTPFGPNAFVD